MGISFPGSDVGMKFRRNDVGLLLPGYGTGTAMNGNRKSLILNFVPTTDFVRYTL